MRLWTILLLTLTAGLCSLPYSHAAWGARSAPVGASGYEYYEWRHPVAGWGYLYQGGQLVGAYSYSTNRYHPVAGDQWGKPCRGPWLAKADGCPCLDGCPCDQCNDDCQCNHGRICSDGCSCLARPEKIKRPRLEEIELADDKLAADIPADIRQWYRNPDGSCVQCSIGMAGVDQNVPAASTLLWDTEYGPAERGGSYPSRVAGYCNRRGIRAYNVTGEPTWDWMRWACANGRGAAIGAGSAHFQTLMGHDPDAGKWWVCNNNSPQKIDEYSEASFRRLHLASGEWVVVLDYPAHPARPVYVQWWAGAGEQPRGFGQTAPEVDRAEIIRLGKMVQLLGDKRHGDNATDAWLEAMKPPAHDADKWFVSVITTRGCPRCADLKRDWSSNQWLRALALPDDHTKSWAHYNVYDLEDASQKWRWEKIKVGSCPTILVQPPRTGKYGEPATVVYQSVYRGDPHAQTQEICSAIRQYVATLPKGQAAAPKPPPWQPPPKDDPAKPGPGPLPDSLTIPPHQGPASQPPVAPIALIVVAGGAFVYLLTRQPQNQVEVNRWNP